MPSGTLLTRTKWSACVALLKATVVHPDATEAGAHLFERVYDELHALAHQHRIYWSGNDTLNTTALVHEAYLKMEGGEARFESRSHFLAVASKAMRHVLINYARAQSAEKRGGKAPVLPLDEAGAVPSSPVRFGELIALDRVLRELQRVKPCAARIVECWFFGGMVVAEAAEALGLSPSTITRTWHTAQAWLYHRLRDEPPSENTVHAPCSLPAICPLTYRTTVSIFVWDDAPSLSRRA